MPVRVARIDRLQTRLAETGRARPEREHDLAEIVLNVVDRDAVMGGNERGEFCRIEGERGGARRFYRAKILEISKSHER